jgi:hypothetical protein
MKLIDPHGKRVLITQSQELMGPARVLVFGAFGAFGAVVQADARPLGDAPVLAARVVESAGDIDVLIAHLALPAPSTALEAVQDEECAECSPTGSIRCRGGRARRGRSSRRVARGAVRRAHRGHRQRGGLMRELPPGRLASGRPD